MKWCLPIIILQSGNFGSKFKPVPDVCAEYALEMMTTMMPVITMIMRDVYVDRFRLFDAYLSSCFMLLSITSNEQFCFDDMS